MFVIADQPAFRIRRKCGLAGARKPKEEGAVASWGGPHVRRAAHRKDALSRQEIIEDREDRLLQLTGVAAATDENRALREVDNDEGLRLGPMDVGIALKVRGWQN